MKDMMNRVKLLFGIISLFSCLNVYSMDIGRGSGQGAGAAKVAEAPCTVCCACNNACEQATIINERFLYCSACFKHYFFSCRACSSCFLRKDACYENHTGGHIWKNSHPLCMFCYEKRHCGSCNKFLNKNLPRRLWKGIVTCRACLMREQARETQRVADERSTCLRPAQAAITGYQYYSGSCHKCWVKCGDLVLCTDNRYYCGSCRGVR